uniref:Uncharacterized protein n=1 Tax=Fagus sylvatica TaxID=28930 RepID=A0A2N9FJR7_FAGSY
MSEKATDYPLSTKEECSPKYGSQADRRIAKYSTPEEGPREGSARVPESPLSSEKPERKEGSRNSKKNSSFLKGGDENRDEQRRSRQSRSYSGSCESPHHAPSPKGRGRESDHRRRRKVSPKGRRQRHSKSPRQEQNPIWRKLQQISHSPFSARIERAKFPARFVTPPLAVYDGKSDPVGHLSRFRQSMAIHNNNDALMCRVFPSSLGEVGLRWFDRLEHGSIRSWKEMSKIFTARFITNTRKPKEIDSLLALTMKAGETLKSYSTRYWEVYNDIDACDEDIVVKTFRFGLHEDSKLRKSFTKRPPLSMAELMTRLEEHIRRNQSPKANHAGQGKPKVQQERPGPECAWPCTQLSRNRSIGSSPSSRTSPTSNGLRSCPVTLQPGRQSHTATIIGKRGHLTENCRAYRYHLEHLVKNGHLKQYVDETKGPHQNVEVPRINVKASAPIGIIDVIHFGSTCHDQRGEMRRAAHLREDLEGVQLPHSDALVITLRIGEFDVKRVLIDPGSSVEIMYESLFKGLGLGKEDLSRTEGPLSGFSGETVIPSGKTMATSNGSGPLHTPPASEVPNTASEERHPQEKCVEKLVPTTTAEGAPQRQFLIGDSLTQEYKSQLLTLLNKYQDVFAWTPYEAPGVDPEFVCHELNVSPEYKPVVQKARRTAPQHAEAVREEVERLLKIGAIREVLYPQWLSNTVVVKKKNGKWRVCVDFTDLNKACPKDPFPLPKIDQLVDSTAGHERMSFLDAFQGYHQIALRKEDQEKTAFITPRGVFCYKVMPFGLKNAGATYQRMVTKMFSELLGRTVEVYIDDMVVKSVKGKDHIEDLERVFGILRRHNLKLNASKCAFGVGSGKFLGFLVTQRGIEANPDQIAAIQGLQPPKNVREVQKLTGMAAALNRFISKSAEKCRPFFDLIKKGKSFAWSEESDRAFEQLKKYLSAPPLLSSPKEGEPLLYLSCNHERGRDEVPTAGEVGPCTARNRKEAPPLLSSPHYDRSDFSTFEGRCSEVRISAPKFAPGDSILTEGEHRKDTERDLERKGWVLYVDGAANSRGSWPGDSPDFARGRTSGAGSQTGIQRLQQRSRLIVNQLTGEYMAKDERMIAYLDLARNLLKGFCKYNIERVGREHNGHADSLAGLASSVAPEFRRTIIVEVQDSPSIAKGGQASVCQVEMGPSWMDPILGYLSNDILPADQKEAAKIRKTATRYWVSREGKLYKKSYTGPYLLCVHPDLVPNLLYEIHEGVCGSHTGGRSLAHRAIGQGYWWPYMQKDAAQYVRRCEKCQLFAPAIHKPASQLNPISSPWPFAQWGLDLVGPLPRATGNRQWLIVATDYFTKWVEAEPLTRITDSESRKFIWKNIITRFGIPRCLVSDNGTQFDSGPFKKYCSDFGIRNHFSSPAYPQGNGQAESSNKVILNGIKKRLEEAKGRWVEELPTVLWTFRTTPRSSTGETPYSLTYGVEAVIPLEVGLPTLRSEEYDQDNNELVLAKDLDLAQERRDLAMIRLASYQGDLKKSYGKSVRERILAPGDLVLRKVLGSKRDPTQGKLGANWEGPYQIVSEAGLGAFNLQGMDGKPLKRPWNISNLKKFYQ